MPAFRFLSALSLFKDLFCFAPGSLWRLKTSAVTKLLSLFLLIVIRTTVTVFQAVESSGQCAFQVLGSPEWSFPPSGGTHSIGSLSHRGRALRSELECKGPYSRQSLFPEFKLVARFEGLRLCSSLKYLPSRVQWLVMPSELVFRDLWARYFTSLRVR